MTCQIMKFESIHVDHLGLEFYLREKEKGYTRQIPLTLISASEFPFKLSTKPVVLTL